MNDCVFWEKAKNKKGYGIRKAKVNGKWKKVLAHRYAWAQERGEIPHGLVIDHLCRNRSCVNTKHMELVTLKENVLRGIGVSAKNKRKTNCIRGHPFTQENTYISGILKYGRRVCKECRKLYWEKRRTGMKRDSKEFREHLKKIGFKGNDSRRSKGKPFTIGHKTNIGKKRIFTEQHKMNISNSKRGKTPWNKGKKKL